MCYQGMIGFYNMIEISTRTPELCPTTGVVWLAHYQHCFQHIISCSYPHISNVNKHAQPMILQLRNVVENGYSSLEGQPLTNAPKYRNTTSRNHK